MVISSAIRSTCATIPLAVCSTPTKFDNSSYSKMLEKYRKSKGVVNLKCINSPCSHGSPCPSTNDMSVSALRRRQTEAEKNVNRLRNCMPEKLTTFCKMHLSFLLDLNGAKLDELFNESSTRCESVNKKKSATPFSKSKKERCRSPSSPFGSSLTKENIGQIYQLIDFLQQPDNIKTEGLFRKTGNLSRQRLLKEWLTDGADLHLDDGTFSPHDCATVLKSFLSELPDPLLTSKHFEAHLQIVDMISSAYLDKDKKRAHDKQIKALQLLIHLLPRENAVLLECLLDLLHRVASVPENMMTAQSLGMVFSPSLLCPKKLTAEEFHSVSGRLTKAVTFMIENATQLFKIPRELALDVAGFWREMEDPNMTAFTDDKSDKDNVDDEANINKTKYGSATAVNTLITFAERKSSEEIESSNDTQIALAQLYAHVQSMPESAKKKKLLKQFNHASTTGSSTKSKHSRSRTFGESLKKHFPILHKHKHRDNTTDRCNTRLTWSISKPINIDQKENVAEVAPFPRTPESTRLEHRSASPAVHVVDLGSSPQTPKARKRLSTESCSNDVTNPKVPHVLASTENEINYLMQSAPAKRSYSRNPDMRIPCTPDIRTKPVAMVSPITQSVTRAPKSTQKAIMTPRSRLPMLLLKSPTESLRESVL